MKKSEIIYKINLTQILNKFDKREKNLTKF